MSDKVFVLSNEKVLTHMTRVGFESEDVFQSLLAEHPEILGGTDAGVPLLVSREQGIADSAVGGSRWSVDHLYLDRRGVPILVEVKRATDSRARREVVAQMLDYASHAVSHWRVDHIQSAFRETCSRRGEGSEDVLAAFLTTDMPAESFWKAVEANLRAGRIRMLFVADEVSSELRRIVEFLNEQMRPAEVLAIEVAHYQAASGARTLVPVTLGATERANAAKSVAEQPAIADAGEWFDRLEAAWGKEIRETSQAVAGIFEGLGGVVAPTASGDALYARWLTIDGKPAWPFFIRHSGGGRVELALVYLKHRPSFASEEARREALMKFREVSPEVKTTNNLGGWPSLSVTAFAREGVRVKFAAFVAWVVERARQA